MINASVQATNEGEIDKFEFELQARGRSQDRVQKMREKWRHLLPYVNKPLTEFTEHDIKKLVITINRNEVRDPDLADATLDDYRCAVKKYFELCSDMDVSWIPTNTRPAHPNIDPRTLPRREHVQELINNCLNRRDAVAAAFIWTTAARSGEARSLKWRNIDFENGVAFLPESKTRTRRVPSKGCINALRLWREAHPCPEPDRYVFYSFGPGRGKQYRGYASKNTLANGFRSGAA